MIIFEQLRPTQPPRNRDIRGLSDLQRQVRLRRQPLVCEAVAFGNNCSREEDAEEAEP